MSIVAELTPRSCNSAVDLRRPKMARVDDENSRLSFRDGFSGSRQRLALTARLCTNRPQVYMLVRGEYSGENVNMDSLHRVRLPVVLDGVCEAFAPRPIKC